MADSFLLALSHKKGKHKTWVAAINGRSRKFGFDREFLGCVSETANGVKASVKEYVIDSGVVYEVCELGERSFVTLRDGQPAKLTKQEVLGFLKAKETELDDAIVRFNAEGGFRIDTPN